MTFLTKSNWKRTSFHAGELKQGKKVSLYFKREPDGPPIHTVVSSCNCAATKLKDDTVEVHFTPQSIPKHLTIQGFYVVTKRVSVIYQNGEVDELEFTAKIIK